jgi:hypothetical protein
MTTAIDEIGHAVGKFFIFCRVIANVNYNRVIKIRAGNLEEIGRRISKAGS